MANLNRRTFLELIGVGGGSGHAFKHGPVLGDYIANRVAGQKTDPELDATFKLKDERF